MKKNKVFFDMSMSVDGLIASEGMDMEHADNPEYKQWLNKWMALQQWVFKQRFFRKNLKLGEDGETGEENRLVEKTFSRTGVRRGAISHTCICFDAYDSHALGASGRHYILFRQRRHRKRA